MALPPALQQQLAGDDQRDLLAAATAFFKWRQAALKANFRRELEGLLEEVAQEEEASGRVQKQLEKTQDRLEETAQALSKVSSDHRLALVHMDQLRTQNNELFKALEAAEGASRAHAEQARTANMLHHDEMKRRQDETKRLTLELDAFREQQQALVTQQQTLLDSLAQRDREVAESTQDCLHHKRNAARLQEEVERLEAIARATGERAAAAEAQAAARNESITKLYSELSGLRERYHAELSELKAARVGAADVQRMRERLDSMQNVNDSLVAARDELRVSLEGVVAKLSAAEQRLKRQAVAANLRDAMLDAITSIGRDADDSHILEATTRLSSELDLALANNADLAERLTSADAVIAQQQGAIRRITEECASVEMQLRESREQRDAQHRINAELAAELQRLAAESALGPILVLDRDGNLIPQEAPVRPRPTATSPATSQLEAQSTAVRVILADKAFGLGALCQAIAAKPGSVQAVRTQLGECRALAESLRADVEEVSALLAVRPFEAEELSRRLPMLQDRLAKTETCLVASREELSHHQVHAVSLEARVLAAESALRSGSALLQGWSGLLSQVAAAEDGRLEPDVRLSLREELKTREDALHRAMLDLAATANPLLSGDPGYAAAQVAMREAGNAVMDLALTLGDRLVDAPATRTRVLTAERLLLDRAGVLARFREVLAGAPGEIADMVERLTAIIPDVQSMGPAIEEMLRCVRHYLAAGKAEVVDVVALQGEVLTLRGLVRTKDITIQALEAVGTGIRSGSPTKRAVKMVPLEALHAAERSRDAVAAEKAALQTRMVDQRVQLVAVRHRIVNYMASLREACEKAEVLYKWRAAVTTIKAERCHKAMVEAQTEQARVEKECREAVAHMEAEVDAMRSSHAADMAAITERHTAAVAALTASHSAAVQALQEAHAAERDKAKSDALQVALIRVALLRKMMKYQTDRWRTALKYFVLYFWRSRCRRQREARQRWYDWSLRLRRMEEPENPTYWDVWRGPRLTIAQRLAQMHLDHGDLRTPAAMTGAQVARVVLLAWRSWAHTKRQARKMDALSEAVPQFIENLGDRRRLERAWLGLRLWTAGSATARAHEAIQDYKAAQKEAEAAKLAAEKAAAESHLATSDAQEQAEAAEARAAAIAHDMSLLVPGYDPERGLAGTQVPTMGGQSGAPGGTLVTAGAGGLPGDPGVDARTQFLPHSHTVLTAGASAPAHAAVEDAVAAAQAAGLGVHMQPLGGAVHQEAQMPPFPPPPLGPGTLLALQTSGGGYPSHPGGAPSGTWIQGAPVPGQGEALDLVRRRKSAPAATTRSLSTGGDGGGRPAASASGALGSRNVSGRGGPSGRGTRRGTSAGGANARSGRATSAGRSAGGSAVGTLAERAERLVRTVDAIAAGVADTASLLTPRTKVLQAAMEDATELAEELSGGEGGGAGGSRPVSPTRHMQPDGTLAIEYHQPRVSGGGSSPTRSPRVSSLGAPLELLPAPATEQQQRASLGPSQPSGGPFSRVDPSAVPRQSEASAAASEQRSRGQPSGQQAASGQAYNSIQVLLGRVPGRNRTVREEPRPVTRVIEQPTRARLPSAAGPVPPRPPQQQARRSGSRLHEETIATTAKKRVAGGPPERGAANLASLPTPPLVPVAAPLSTLLPPRTNVPGPVTAYQVDMGVQGAPVPLPSTAVPQTAPQQAYVSWPHTSGAIVTSAYTAEPMRRREEPNVPTIGVRVSQPPAHYPSQERLVSMAQELQPMAPPAGARVGKVVRFERMSPPPPPPAAPPLPPPLPFPEEDEAPVDDGAEGPVTYISLPSPVRVNIRLPSA